VHPWLGGLARSRPDADAPYDGVADPALAGRASQSGNGRADIEASRTTIQTPALGQRGLVPHFDYRASRLAHPVVPARRSTTTPSPPGHGCLMLFRNCSITITAAVGLRRSTHAWLERVTRTSTYPGLWVHPDLCIREAPPHPDETVRTAKGTTASPRLTAAGRWSRRGSGASGTMRRKCSEPLTHV
jgi:hypothetical protein